MTSGERRVRLPDYVIVGMMKSGTTSLYQWLGGQPECALAREKEPDYFSREDVWQRGLEWYSELFADAPLGKLIGEASKSYTKPFQSSPLAARRMPRSFPTCASCACCVTRSSVFAPTTATRCAGAASGTL